MAFERLIRNESQWKTPGLPAIPAGLGGDAGASVLLTRREPGEWEFLFREIAGIPSACAENQDYDFGTVPADEWRLVTAPGSLMMQGFDIENNTEYYYRRSLTLPEAFGGHRVFLRFEGVYSHARVWINNRFVKSHAGGFTAWDCEITPFAREKAITLVVGVTDAEGERRGPWNPGGEKISSGAWASYYAHCNIGGILRDITLFALPEHHIARTHIGTRLTSQRDACIDVDCEIVTANAGDIICAQLIDTDGSVVAEVSGTLEGFRMPEEDWRPNTITPDAKWARRYPKSNANDRKYSPLYRQDPSPAQGARYGIRFSLPVANAKLWDAEHPNLYQLKMSLLFGGQTVQENLHTVGIREITYGGRNGTDRNRVYVNGREVKLRGLCHHDVSHLYGRSLTREEIEYEIRTYKEHNINFIRTSHYPASDYLLTVCDRLGIYVEQENSACFKGANGFDIYNPPEEFLSTFAEMVESACSHPSVIIWSLANESGFEETYAFRAEYEYVKAMDPSRPVIFSYPFTVHTKPLPYDIYSKHYEKVTHDLGKRGMPILHDEFAHVCCYNVEQLREDNSRREFWGESIARGWDGIFRTGGALGCAIWAGIDDVFYLPEGTQERHQTHTDGRCAGYGEWGCIFDAYKRLKPEAYLTKRAFTPVLVDERKSSVGETVKLYITNRFDHTNLTEVRAVCTDGDGSILFDGNIPQPIAPHCSGYVELPCTAGDGKVNIRFYQDGYEVDAYAFGRQEPEPVPHSCAAPVVETGSSLAFTCGGRTLFGNPRLSVRGVTGQKTPENTHLKNIRQSGSRISGTFRAGKFKTFRLDVEQKEQELEFRLSPKNIFAWFTDAGRLALEFDLMEGVESVSWHRMAFHSVYPEDHIGRPEGTAYAVRGDANGPDAYGVKPDYGWGQSMTNYFLFKEDSQANSIATNDFKTRRNHIHDYTVNLKNGGKLRVDARCRELNAYVRVPRQAGAAAARLQLTVGSYYPDLQWGNYFGKRPGFGRALRFSVSLPGRKGGE